MGLPYFAAGDHHLLFISISSKVRRMKNLSVLVDADALDKMAEREHKLTKWLNDKHGAQVKDARHLDEGTTERAYWHLGYLTALRDALRLLQKDEKQRLAS